MSKLPAKTDDVVLPLLPEIAICLWARTVFVKI